MVLSPPRPRLGRRLPSALRLPLADARNGRWLDVLRTKRPDYGRTAGYLLRYAPFTHTCALQDLGVSALLVQHSCFALSPRNVLLDLLEAFRHRSAASMLSADLWRIEDDPKPQIVDLRARRELPLVVIANRLQCICAAAVRRFSYSYRATICVPAVSLGGI